MVFTTSPCQSLMQLFLVSSPLVAPDVYLPTSTRALSSDPDLTRRFLDRQFDEPGLLAVHGAAVCGRNGGESEKSS